MTTIDLRLAQNMAKFAASKEETRYYLRGVYIEASQNSVTYFATDGHRAICAARHDRSESAETFNLIIPYEFLMSLKFTVRMGDEDCEAKLDRISFPFTFKLSDTDTRSFSPVDGDYPDWKRLIPDGLSNEPAQFNHKYLHDFERFSKAMGGDFKIEIGYNGNGPALIRFSSDLPDCFAICMPMRTDFTGGTEYNLAFPQYVKTGPSNDLAVH